ncbi:hypothetical protein [Pararhizobium sp. DWP1-1-3]|uniref:hypothetical protein n=1 Tax=Pararhizobium sp. DWP1-1-3 TaxID=2804652 RepID=UPI003CFB97BB
MEKVLRQSLLNTAAVYARASGCAISTVSRRVKNNAAFFKDIGDPTKSFTARTYDEVMRWFAKNWPEGKERPFELLKWIRESDERRLKVTA